MLRPATPLTILLLAAFALLLISVISTPIIQAIPLATYGGVDFGVFGYCQGSTCSKIEIGYNTADLFTDTQAASFDLPTSARTTLSAILIVHPVAAFFTLVMLVLSASAHFHAPSHSPRYLLGIFILSILTLVLALLSFLIDVLLFVPHMAWGSYLVLAATVLIAASGIVSCAMRRTLVSRKARKRRIAENAEMNGENFYNRQGTGPTVPTDPSTALVASEADKQPSFANFDMTKPGASRMSDERIPLTTMTTTETSPPHTGVPGEAVGMVDRFGQPGQNPPREPFRDHYGNPLPPPPMPYGARSRDPSADPSMDRQYSENSMNYRGRGGMPPPGGFRGRGGYAPNGRGYGPQRGGGGYGPRGGYGPGPQRGNFNGPYRGGMNDGMRGGRGALPPMYGQPRNGPGYSNRDPSPAGNYGRGPSPPRQPGPAYGQNNYAPAPPIGQYAAYNPDLDGDGLPRAESPPPLPEDLPGPVGQAIEMDATTGSPSMAPRGFGQFGGIRESDGDVAGMVGLQQQRLQGNRIVSETSRYSEEEGAYVPPRQAWGGNGPLSPLNPVSQPAELPSPTAATHKRENSGDNYYEDVDPRFAEQPQAGPAEVPSILSTGYPAQPQQGLRPLHTNPHGLDGSNSYEDLHSGSRSPAVSEASNFTSISQRGVNPRWNGPPQNYAPMPTRRPLPPQNDILFNSNPDFQLPGGRGGRGGRGGMRGGMIPASAYPGPSAL